MNADLTCPRLNDIPIALVDGGTTNLSHFCGQKLIVFFCPAGDAEAAAHEIAAYEALARAFDGSGAWVIGIVPAAVAPEVAGEARINLGLDPDGAAFKALTASLPEEIEVDLADGTAFLIDRDGAIRAAWPGSGHAAHALEAAHQRP